MHSEIGKVTLHNVQVACAIIMHLISKTLSITILKYVIYAIQWLWTQTLS